MNKYKDNKIFSFLRVIVSFLFKLIYHPKIINQNNIPVNGRVIIAGNHTDYFDPLLLMCCTKRGIHFLAKKELFVGFKKILFSNIGLIPVDRSKKDSFALQEAINYLNNDKVIGIFPEGTFEYNNKDLLPFKKGAVKMAIEANSVIIPFGISGKFRPFINDLTIKFGEAFIPNKDLEKANDDLKNVVDELRKG